MNDAFLPSPFSQHLVDNPLTDNRKTTVILLIQSLSTMFCSLFRFAQDGGEKLKGDPMDLRLDIERRKKYSMHDRVTGDSQDFGQEKSEKNCSKYHKISKYVQIPCILELFNSGHVGDIL